MDFDFTLEEAHLVNDWLIDICQTDYDSMGEFEKVIMESAFKVYLEEFGEADNPLHGVDEIPDWALREFCQQYGSFFK